MISSWTWHILLTPSLLTDLRKQAICGSDTPKPQVGRRPSVQWVWDLFAQTLDPVRHLSSASAVRTHSKQLAPHGCRSSVGVPVSISSQSKWSEVTQSCPTLCDPMNCSLPCSSIRGILQTRILEWVAISFSWRSSQPRDWSWVSHIAGRCFTIWATREAHSQSKPVAKLSFFLRATQTV